MKKITIIVMILIIISVLLITKKALNFCNVISTYNKFEYGFEKIWVNEKERLELNESENYLIYDSLDGFNIRLSPDLSKIIRLNFEFISIKSKSKSKSKSNKLYQYKYENSKLSLIPYKYIYEITNVKSALTVDKTMNLLDKINLHNLQNTLGSTQLFYEIQCCGSLNINDISKNLTIHEDYYLANLGKLERLKNIDNIPVDKKFLKVRCSSMETKNKNTYGIYKTIIILLPY